MKRRSTIVMGLAFGACLVAVAGQGLSAADDDKTYANRSPAEWQDFIETNCVACHSERKHEGGLVLAGKSLGEIGTNTEIWEKVVYKVSEGEMPPLDARTRPDPHERAAFVSWLTNSLDHHAAIRPDAGRPVIRRLTRFEYNNAVRDLLDVEMNTIEDLPADAVVDGFDNIGDALTVSPLMLERYIRAARLVTRAAIGDTALPRTILTAAGPDRQTIWRKGVPLGAHRGPVLNGYFPNAGDYVIRVIVGVEDSAPIEGRRNFTAKTTLTAGAHRIAAMVPDENMLGEGPIADIEGPAGRIGGPLNQMATTGTLPKLDVRVDGKLVERFDILRPTADDLQAPNATVIGAPLILRVEVDGPINRTPSAETPSQARIFICKPSASDKGTACARQILGKVVRRAYRRDVGTQDVAPYLALYGTARRRGEGFEIAIQEALQAVLVSPDFLFRIEQDPSGKDRNYRIADFDLASRLSFFLWSSIPDERLLDLAHSGRLSKPKVLEKEVRRMLADRRADTLVDNFGLQYLGVQGVEAAQVDKAAYPTFNQTTRADFLEETRLFVRSVMRSNASVIDLIGANYTYLNENLAKHYDVKGVFGPGFRRVSFDADDIRGGILGQGSVLLATSNPNITSPVLRGKWVLTNLFDQPPPPPPPGIPALKGESKSGVKLTGREKMEMHRTNPVCASCHARMDPFGFALENLDVTGAWRTRDEAGFVDANVQVPNGTKFEGVVGLRHYLVSRRDDIARAFTARLMTYALGRRMTPSDAAIVRSIARKTKADDYRFQSIVLEIINSTPFQMRRKDEQI